MLHPEVQPQDMKIMFDCNVATIDQMQHSEQWHAMSGPAAVCLIAMRCSTDKLIR